METKKLYKSRQKFCSYCKNFLHWEFYADRPNEKWLTDVMEFKYYAGKKVHKIYLSAILDLCDERIVSYKISIHNDNALVMDTFD